MTMHASLQEAICHLCSSALCFQGVWNSRCKQPHHVDKIKLVELCETSESEFSSVSTSMIDVTLPYHILPQTITFYPGRVIMIHISYLSLFLVHDIIIVFF